jgi:hypothetical protein
LVRSECIVKASAACRLVSLAGFCSSSHGARRENIRAMVYDRKAVSVNDGEISTVELRAYFGSI